MAAKQKFSWSEIVNTVRTCREVAGHTAPSRNAVEQLLGGGDPTRITVAIRAVEAEYGFHPEFLDTLTPELRALVTDPRQPGGRLAVPAIMSTDLPEDFTSLLITMTGTLQQILDQTATNAAVLVADYNKRADERVAKAEGAVADTTKALKKAEKEGADLRQKLAAAERRAERAEAACTAYKNGKRAVAGLEAKFEDLTEAMKTRTAPPTAATRKRAKAAAR